MMIDSPSDSQQQKKDENQSNIEYCRPSRPQSTIKRGIRGVMVGVVGNGPDDTSSNHRRS